jgi:hypothetical protein
LQAALVYVNPLMIQDLLAEPAWANVLTPEDRRSLMPLFWSHCCPTAEVKLNMADQPAAAAQAAPAGDPVPDIVPDSLGVQRDPPARFGARDVKPSPVLVARGGVAEA